MKKELYLLFGALTLASCSSDDIVKPVEPNPALTETPMSFSVRTENQGRADAGLQTVHSNFGVYGFKDTELIMPNYLVGYNASGYYKAPAGIDLNDSSWFYEGLGYDEYSNTTNGYIKPNGGNYAKLYKSANANQFLKYWDFSATNYYFYAYAPYRLAAENTLATVSAGATAGTATMTFNERFYNSTSQENEMMFATTTVGNNDFGNDVPLSFQRVVSALNIAFYEEINGYKVKILSSTNSKVPSTLPDYCDWQGVVFMPVSDTTTEVKDSEGNVTGVKYSLGKIVSSFIPKVDFSGSTVTVSNTGNLFYTPSVFYNYFSNTLSPLYTKSGGTTDGIYIGETSANKSTSETTWYVVPAKDLSATNDGFLVYVTYQLVSEDTAETITVKNAAVHIPSSACQWEANKLYTYILKITKNSPGSTDPTDPDPDPDGPTVPDDPALKPIVFDGITVQELTTAGTSSTYPL